MTTFETNALEINDLNKNYPGFSLNHLNLTPLDNYKTTKPVSPCG